MVRLTVFVGVVLLIVACGAFTVNPETGRTPAQDAIESVKTVVDGAQPWIPSPWGEVAGGVVSLAVLVVGGLKVRNSEPGKFFGRLRRPKAPALAT